MENCFKPGAFVSDRPSLRIDLTVAKLTSGVPAIHLRPSPLISVEALVVLPRASSEASKASTMCQDEATPSCHVFRPSAFNAQQV